MGAYLGYYGRCMPISLWTSCTASCGTAPTMYRRCWQQRQPQAQQQQTRPPLQPRTRLQQSSVRSLHSHKVRLGGDHSSICCAIQVACPDSAEQAHFGLQVCLQMQHASYTVTGQSLLLKPLSTASRHWLPRNFITSAACSRLFHGTYLETDHSC